MKHYLVLLVLAFAITGCSDTDLAKKMVGTWQGSYTMSYDDGSKEEVTEELTFDKDADTDGGTFTEVLQGTVHDEDEYGKIEAGYVSTIQGKWEINAGDLDFTYTISSLNVSVPESAIKIKFSNDLSGVSSALDALSYSMDNWRSVESEIAEEMQKDAYKEMFDAYKESNDEEGSYTDIKIENDVLSFTTSDMGRMEFKRISAPTINSNDSAPSQTSPDENNATNEQNTNGNDGSDESSSGNSDDDTNVGEDNSENDQSSSDESSDGSSDESESTNESE